MTTTTRKRIVKNPWKYPTHFPQVSSVKEALTWRWPYKILIVICALIASVAGLLAPFSQQQFLNHLDYVAFFYCCLLMFTYFLFFQVTQYLSQIEATVTQHVVADYLYKRILSLNYQTTSKKSVGELIALYTTDIPSLTQWLEQTLPYFLTTTIPLILTPIFLKFYYQIALLDSFLFLGALLAVNLFMAKRQSYFFAQFKKLAAERMGLVNEWIQNIRNLRLLNWVEAFEKKMIDKRIDETDNRVAMVTNGQLMNSFSSSITFWFNLAILAYFILHYTNEVKKEDLLILIWIVGVFLSRPVRQLPWLLTMFFDAQTSYKRLKEFFAIENLEPVIHQDSEATSKNLVIDIKNLNLNIGVHHLLKNINLQVAPSEIIALIGPVGAGKSLLMKSLINEVAFDAESFHVARSRYLPQSPFIFSSTIQNNLSFRYEHDDRDSKERCMQALDAAAFTVDLKMFPQGLDTMMGERGLNISGGQKQRLHLARLFYDPAPLFLLDDPFSAVDVSTEKKLISTIESYRGQKNSFVIITQRYEFLKHCDRLIYMEDGEIHFDGKYPDFIKNPKFLEFIEAKSKTEEAQNGI